MQNMTLNAIILIATYVLSTGATAQNTYKCGDSYSQQPCPGGVVIDAADQRTPGQKTQADSATGRDARTADAMEKARRQQEKVDLAANTPPLKPASAEIAGTPGSTQVKKNKKKQPEYFTAQVPGEKKKKKAAKKSVKKEVASKS